MDKRKIKWSDYLFKVSLSLLLMLTAVFPVFALQFSSAEDSTYSNVLEDLQKDENFNVEDYPVIADNYSLQVVQIAETTGKELLIYVYQPSGAVVDLKATSINISTAIGDSLKHINYQLKFLNSDGTLYKYVVQGLKVRQEPLRYYDITSIYREYFSTFDKDVEISKDNEIDEVAFSVAKLYTATTINDNVTYNCENTKVIRITAKRNGKIRYSNGFKFFAEDCDSHYVAFSTDIPLENIVKADLSYMIAEYSQDIFHVSYGESKKEERTIRAYEKVSNSADGLFSKKYEWERIEKCSDFIEKEDLDNEIKKEIRGMQWVLRYKETSCVTAPFVWGSRITHGYAITELTILDLTYVENGVAYTLGVIDNKQSGSIFPDNDKHSDLFWILVGILLLIALIVMLQIFGFLKPLLEFLFVIIKNLFIALWWLISAPFSLFFDD